MGQRTITTLVMAALGVALAFGTALVQPIAAHHPTADAPSIQALYQTPDAAMRASVESTGRVYAGDCTNTTSPQDLGKTCSKFVAARGAMSAYVAGRTFSEFTAWLFIEQTPAGWQVVGTASVDFQTAPAVIPWPAG